MIESIPLYRGEMWSLTEKLRSENKAFQVTREKSVTNLVPVVWKNK